MPVLTLDAAKRQLKITTDAHDQDLADYIAGVTEVVEHYVGPVDDRQVVERWSGWREVIAVRHTPVVEVVEVTYLDGGQAVDVADVDVDPVTGALQLISATRWPAGRLRITYTAGRGGVAPHSAQVAALMIVQHLWEVRRGADSRRPTFSPVEPTVNVTTPNYTFSVPKRAVQLLEPHATGPAVS
ncbi:head-tail connector protein [Nocardiopsis dassonvillei]|uniref:head-tail connector protein n=1 Tax=Nocardiopsis dassonvillei TaxID=2014 RepID=UPI00362F4167